MFISHPLCIERLANCLAHPLFFFFLVALLRYNSHATQFIHLKCMIQDFPGGPVVKNLPCNAGDMGLILGWGTKSPHAAEELSPSTPTRESMYHMT